MLVTPEEAATRRCHEAYAASDGVTFGNVGVTHTAALSPPLSSFAGGSMIGKQGPSAPFNCIGPRCMAWRMTERRTLDVTYLGYCGKAGRID